MNYVFQKAGARSRIVVVVDKNYISSDNCLRHGAAPNPSMNLSQVHLVILIINIYLKSPAAPCFHHLNLNVDSPLMNSCYDQNVGRCLEHIDTSNCIVTKDDVNKSGEEHVTMMFFSDFWQCHKKSQHSFMTVFVLSWLLHFHYCPIWNLSKLQ